MSGFKLGSMNEDVVKNILKEEERVLAAGRRHRSYSNGS